MGAKGKADKPFWLGGAAASMAVCFTHPLDQTKRSRMQVTHARAPLLRTLSAFAARDGILSLWDGLSASILRQATYSTARFGLYNYFARQFQSLSAGGGPLSASATVATAGLAGGLAGVIGNPTEVVLVRMCADGAKPPAQRFAYPNALVGLFRTVSEEGPRVLGRGLSANVARSVLMNVGQIAPYTAAKRALLKNTSLRDGMGTHALASLAAGTVATTACAPFDVLKSRIQAASAGGGSSSLVQVVSSGLREEGPRFLMKGWTPAWLRLTPHTVLTFVFMEKLETLVNLRALSPIRMEA
ncbi:hypothetical protein NKR23_g5304 [Pleurostoma richardsiae]|uniref:Mitochondrial dicarboxylate transporter n=1 Tax=Pleurostoma richardsiae TaxID=41990 RepID=A0AA38VJA7_9PEZI|nr:hypothetical protein NKR23_g5304 [Pleurostoma richardsiae]